MMRPALLPFRPCADKWRTRLSHNFIIGRVLDKFSTLFDDAHIATLCEIRLILKSEP